MNTKAYYKAPKGSGMSIKKFLKKEPTDLVLFQTRVDRKLRDKFAAKAEKEGYTIQEVVSAMMQAYLEEK